MQSDNDKLKGILGTVIFHGLLIIALLFLALRTPLPLPEEAGVEVNLGYSDDGMGDIQPPAPAPQAAAPAPSTPQQSAEDLVTENTEEVPAIKPVIKEKPNPEVKPEVKPTPKPQPTPEPQPVVDQRAMFPSKKGNNAQGGNQGITGKPGDQGKPTGDPNAQGYDGSGGGGGGVKFSLDGRSRIELPMPPYNLVHSNSLTVVVTIYVNRAGEVTRAIARIKGSTTTSTELIKLAKDAAMKARFSAKEDAPIEQVGTLIYTFKPN